MTQQRLSSFGAIHEHLESTTIPGGWRITAAGARVLAEPKTDKPLLFKLGLVTYNVAANWDLPTTLKVCKAVGIAAVECRTTHKHGVEPSLEGRAAQGRQEAVRRHRRRVLGLRQRLRVSFARRRPS